jgi:hypothetical protein
VWVWSKDGTQVRRKAPEKIFCETEFYKVHGPNGERDLTIEHNLSRLEAEFSKLRRLKLERRKSLSEHEHRNHIKGIGKFPIPFMF